MNKSKTLKVKGNNHKCNDCDTRFKKTKDEKQESLVDLWMYEHESKLYCGACYIKKI